VICGNRQDGARADVALFAGLEEATRPPPLVFAAIYALLLVAIPAARGPERRAALLFAPLAVFGLLGPVFTSGLRLALRRPDVRLRRGGGRDRWLGGDRRRAGSSGGAAGSVSAG